MRRAALGCVVALALSVADSARASPGAPDKGECAASYEAGQVERKERRFLAARKDLVTCASATCPSGMQRECAGWLAEVEGATPTVVVRARMPDGRDAVDVHVLVDGEVVATRLDGAALALDPGERRFRFEHPPLAPVERTLVVHEGDKLVPIDVALGGPPAPRAADPPWAAIALGGLGAGALVVFAALGASGVSRYHELEDTCAPRCSESDTSALQRRFVVADIALGVGIAALAGAAVLIVIHRANASGSARTAAGRFTF
jgi:hypothetical protein